MELEPKPSPEHVLSFQNTILFKIVRKQRIGAVTSSDGDGYFLGPPRHSRSPVRGSDCSYPETPEKPGMESKPDVAGNAWNFPDQVLG